MKITRYIIIGLTTLALASCNDWFDVTSSNEIREKDHFAIDQGFAQSVTGCYIKMGEDALYGQYVSYGLPEIAVNPYRLMGTADPDHRAYAYIQRHLWNSVEAKAVIDNIWSASYSVIANANEALKSIDEKESSMDPINFHVIKGELFATRALMHFNLLRYFGYGNWANRKAELDAKLTIPYVATVEKHLTPQSSGAAVIANILKDLSDAAALMKDYDPASSTHEAGYYNDVDEEGFYESRNFHLNYYAVRALTAQVYQWIGDYASALTPAKEVIDAIGTGKKVTFGNVSVFTLHLMPVNEITATTTALTREAVFAIETRDLDIKTSKLFDPNYNANNEETMSLNETHIQELFNNSNTDSRFVKLLYHNMNASPAGYVPQKYYSGFGVDNYFKNKINVIRLPELYYIAAESYARNGDTVQAMELLNTVREARGLYGPLTDLDKDQLLEEIEKEYQREFLAEGMMFFYYKRNGATKVPAKSGEMTDADYVLPYPDIEIQSGRIQ